MKLKRVIKRTATVAQIIDMLKKGRKVTTVGGTPHSLPYCKKVKDKKVQREVLIAA